MRYGQRRGFSLVEFTVAVTVLAIVMLGAFSSQVASRNLLAEARETDLAVDTLRSTMDRLLVRGLEELVDENGDHPPGNAIDVGECPLQDVNVLFSTPGYVPGDPTPDELTIRLELTWTSATRQPRELTLSCIHR